ncbi:MAG TPA: multiubiquitin domain-containing protein [Steroidobacteraceae bacterium]|nr:multiubiquitin domain-containing protein [Steroidobacteraceae bacterium]
MSNESDHKPDHKPDDHHDQHHDPKPKEYHFFVDGKKYETLQSSLSGGEIKAQAGVPTPYQLFLEEHGNAPDRAISDGETIDLAKGAKHFYAVPPATFGDL